MALSFSNVFHSPNIKTPNTKTPNIKTPVPNPQISLRRSYNLKTLKTPVSTFPPSSSVRFPRVISFNKRVICAVASATGSSNPDRDLNPYEVLGVSPIEEPSMVRAAYSKKLKEAERNNDEVTTARLEMAYDKILMEYDKMIMEFDKMMRLPLSKRKKGVSFGSFKEKDGAGSSNPDSDLNPYEVLDLSPIEGFGTSMVMAGFEMLKAAYAKKFEEAERNYDEVTTAQLEMAYDKIMMEYQKIMMKYAKLLHERLSERKITFESFKEDGEDDGQARRRKWILFSLTLVFVCVALSSLGYTRILNLILNVIENVKGWFRVYLNADMLVIGIIVSVINLKWGRRDD